MKLRNPKRTPKRYVPMLRELGARARAPRVAHAWRWLGLRRRRSSWESRMPGLGLLGAGVLVGAGCIMLFAPQRVVGSGDEPATSRRRGRGRSQRSSRDSAARGQQGRNA